MSNERDYYIADGDDLDRAEAFIAKREEAFDAMTTLAQKHGGRAIHNGQLIIGLAFDGEPPEGWKYRGDCDGKPYYFPKQTTKEARRLVKELQSVRAGDAWAFHNLFCKDGGTRAGPGDRPWSTRIIFTIWERIGGALILSVPSASDFKPTGSRKLRMSEYWTLREAVETAEAMAPFDESASFICDAAMFHGFEYDDEAEGYRASEATLVAFVRAVREQGRKDAQGQAVAALQAVLPYVDSIVCYASTISEHEGNRVAKLVQEAVRPTTEGAAQ